MSDEQVELVLKFMVLNWKPEAEPSRYLNKELEISS